MLKSTDKEEAKVTNGAPVSDVVDINISSMKKQRFRINGDDDKILELNVSDLGIITRLSELYPKLQELADKASTVGLDEEDASDDSEKFKAQLDKFGKQLKEIDEGMREYIDELFQANVSELCAPYGNMYDVVDGDFRYNNIIDKLSDLYEANIEKETKALKSRLAKRVEKYVPQDRKRTTRKSKQS